MLRRNELAEALAPERPLAPQQPRGNSESCAAGSWLPGSSELADAVRVWGIPTPSGPTETHPSVFRRMQKPKRAKQTQLSNSSDVQSL